jgi:hypothetical protein
MANIKQARMEKLTDSATKTGLDSEKEQIRTMRIMFGLFSILLIILTVLTLAVSP